MKVNVTLLATLVLAIVIGGTILFWIFKASRRDPQQASRQPQLPPGPVGFKLLPACTLPERACIG